MAFAAHIDGLIRRIHGKRASGKLEWREGPAKDEFSHGFSSGFVSINYTNGGYVFSVMNPAGQVIDAVRTVNMSQDYQMLSEIYDSARRQARRVDATVAQMLKELE